MKPKLLYVDDEQTNCDLFHINFKRHYSIVTANNGIQGLKLLEEQDDIRIVISDMKMPKMSGIDFIKKAKEQHGNIHYYILTGYEITDEIETALNDCLIHEYFKKPFDIPFIAASLNEALSLSS